MAIFNNNEVTVTAVFKYLPLLVIMELLRVRSWERNRGSLLIKLDWKDNSREILSKSCIHNSPCTLLRKVAYANILESVYVCNNSSDSFQPNSNSLKQEYAYFYAELWNKMFTRTELRSAFSRFFKRTNFPLLVAFFRFQGKLLCRIPK